MARQTPRTLTTSEIPSTSPTGRGGFGITIWAKGLHRQGRKFYSHWGFPLIKRGSETTTSGRRRQWFKRRNTRSEVQDLIPRVLIPVIPISAPSSACENRPVLAVHKQALLQIPLPLTVPSFGPPQDGGKCYVAVINEGWANQRRRGEGAPHELFPVYRSPRPKPRRLAGDKPLATVRVD